MARRLGGNSAGADYDRGRGMVQDTLDFSLGLARVDRDNDRLHLPHRKERSDRRDTVFCQQEDALARTYAPCAQFSRDGVNRSVEVGIRKSCAVVV